MLFVSACFSALASTPLPLPPTTTAQSTLAPPATRPATESPIRAGAIGPEIYPPDVNPLTGLRVDDVSLLARRPVIAKISNAPPLVRPQAGIGAADLVFEHYAEGGLTRFSGVFYSNMPQRVGSVRSARLIDYELVPMYQGLLAFSGASIGVEEYINTSEFADRAYKGVLFGLPYYWRDENIPVPHNMFVNLEALSQLATQDGVNTTPTLRGMAFLEEAPPADDGAAHSADIRYMATRVRWDYDAASNRYLRFSDGEAHLDANTGEQVSAANVLILFANHRFTDIVESVFQDNVSYSIEMQLWFEGEGILLRDGRQYRVQWRRPTRESLISLRTIDGENLMYFKPGNTWIQVVRPPEQQDSNTEWVRIE